MHSVYKIGRKKSILFLNICETKKQNDTTNQITCKREPDVLNRVGFMFIIYYIYYSNCINFIYSKLLIMQTYNVVCRENGSIICENLTLDMANYMIHEYECADKLNNEFTLNFYEIIEIN